MGAPYVNILIQPHYKVCLVLDVSCGWDNMVRLHLKKKKKKKKKKFKKKKKKKKKKNKKKNFLKKKKKEKII